MEALALRHSQVIYGEPAYQGTCGPVACAVPSGAPGCARVQPWASSLRKTAYLASVTSTTATLGVSVPTVAVTHHKAAHSPQVLGEPDFPPLAECTTFHQSVMLTGCGPCVRARAR